MCIGGIIMALRQDVPLSISIIIIVPVMAVVIGVIMRRALPLFKSMQVKIDRLNQESARSLPESGSSEPLLNRLRRGAIR